MQSSKSPSVQSTNTTTHNTTISDGISVAYYTIRRTLVFTTHIALAVLTLQSNNQVVRLLHFIVIIVIASIFNSPVRREPLNVRIYPSYLDGKRFSCCCCCRESGVIVNGQALYCWYLIKGTTTAVTTAGGTRFTLAFLESSPPSKPRLNVHTHPEEL